ncbi:MAG: fatty acid desaturase [Verrucomicrobia bacterium]|nr:fatty acid desaturase [Verrucomicrobiota bacterium]
MRTGQDLIKATKQYAHDDTARSWWYVLSTTGLLLATLAGVLWNHSFPAQLLCSVFAGLLILRMFVIYHDQQHHAILPKSFAAEIYMRVFGILALSASSIWRSSHNHHHNHNSKLRGSHIGSFPIMTKQQFLKTTRAKRFWYLFARHPLTILFGYVFVFLLGMCVNPFVNNPRKHYDCLISLLLHITIGTLLYVTHGWQAVLLVQTVPHFIAYAIGSYLFYAQHNFPDVSFADNAGWTYEKAALDSSSYLRSSRLMAWFTANIGYHHIHHLNSHIPFYRLPEALREMPELQLAKTTSFNPLEMARCLRLKVWDSETQQMVGRPQLAEATTPAGHAA